MNILGHRGIWADRSQQNTLESLTACVPLGYGIELDVRDRNGELVVSHDLTEDDSPLLEDVLCALSGFDSYIAVNIKEDGLCISTSLMCDKFNIRHYLFDMSVPETVICEKNLLPYFTRLSEYESPSVLDDKASGVWLDAFKFQWFDASLIGSLLNSEREVAVVSSELHGRDHRDLWLLLKQFSDHPNLSICTDFPHEADRFFNTD